MHIPFYKYQGTGNDFVVIDNRRSVFNKNNTKMVAQMCDRKFGIGADGLILLEEADQADFKMVYFNADGMPGSMCGNGGRCLVAFAKMLGLIDEKCVFEAVDGLHEAIWRKDNTVSLKMKNVSHVEVKEDFVFLDTGSPHHVVFVDQLDKRDVYSEGKAIRYGRYGNEGANVNFAEQTANDVFSVRTYERGVENETLSCGTGVTAVALAAFVLKKNQQPLVNLNTPGGSLKVRFDAVAQGFENVFLEGPATLVFKGEYLC